MREFGVETEHANNQQDEENVGLDDARKKLLSRGELKRHTQRVRERKLHLRAVKASDFASIKLAQQIILGIGDEIDELALQRFLFCESFGFGDRGLRQRRIAAALFREAAQKC